MILNGFIIYWVFYTVFSLIICFNCSFNIVGIVNMYFYLLVQIRFILRKTDT